MDENDESTAKIILNEQLAGDSVVLPQHMEEGQEHWMSEEALTEAGYTLVQQPLDASENPELQGAIVYQTEDGQTFILAPSDQNEDGQSFILAQPDGAQDGQTYFVTQGENGEQTFILAQTDGHNEGLILAQTEDSQNSQGLILANTEDSQNSQDLVMGQTEDSQSNQSLILAQNEDNHNHTDSKHTELIVGQGDQNGQTLLFQTESNGQQIIITKPNENRVTFSNDSVSQSQNVKTKSSEYNIVINNAKKKQEVSIEQALNDLENDPEALGAFLIRKTDGKVIVSSEKDKKEEDDGNNTDELLEILGERNKEESKKKVYTKVLKRKDSGEQNSSDNEKHPSQNMSSKRVKFSKSEWSRKYPAKVVSTTSNKIVMLPRKPPPQPAMKKEEDSDATDASADEREERAKPPATPKLVTTSVSTARPNVQVTTRVVARPASNVSPLRTYQRGPALRVTTAGSAPSLVRQEPARLEVRLEKVPQTQTQPQKIAKTVTSEVIKRHPMSPEVLKERLAKSPLSTQQIKEKIEKHINLPQRTQPKLINKILEEKSQKEKPMFFSKILSNAPVKPVLMKRHESPVDILKKKLESPKEQSSSVEEKVPIVKRLEAELEMDSDGSADDYEDDMMTSESDDSDEAWFTLDIRAERAAEYVSTVGPKAEQLLLEEKTRATAIMASLQNKVAALKQKWRTQSEELKNAQMTLEELEVAMTVT